MRFGQITFVVVSLCFYPAVRAGFVNESFETGDFTGWIVGGNAEHEVALANTPIDGTDISGNYVKPRTGEYAAWVKLGTTDPETTFSLEQTVAVTPGAKYQWGFSHGVFSDPPLYNSQFGLRRWINGNLFSTGSGSIGSGYMGFITGFTAPAGLSVATFKIEWTGNVIGGGVAGFTIDDVFFRPVPEPGLVGAGVLATLLVRRRVKNLNRR